MAESSRRPPKSSLAALRTTAAPWGIPVPAKPKAPVLASASIPIRAARPATAGQTRVRSASEQRTIVTVIAAGVGLLLALSVMGAKASFAVSASEQAIGGTLGRASLAQMEFRARHERFALWEELEAKGMRLPEDVTVLHSNATTSHWYLRLRHRATGVTCERLGQLTDPPSDLVKPTCARAP